MNAAEMEIRARLGIPPEAERVLVIAESSHWDPDWLKTSAEYYRRYVDGNLTRALAELGCEPGRVYSVECVFFLRMFWDAHPELRPAVRELVNSRRLRLTSSGVTTADTLIPRTESVLRDFLLGQEWLRANGMTQEPTLAYFPDSFGCSHALPSLLNAAGFQSTAVSRVDGMFFLGCDLDLPSRYPRPGSTAALLGQDLKSLDFVWRDNLGGEVLCHWNAFTYGQGDMLAYSGFSRMYLFPLARYNPAPAHVAAQIRGFVRQLAPLSKTPYLFCPMGLDFVGPTPGLAGLLERYNQQNAAKEGTWVVNAGLDDYLDLVNCRRASLPVLELDPNPYWTGFYSSRPSLKKLAHQLTDQLLLTETLAARLHCLGGAAPRAASSPRPPAVDQAPWWSSVASNHHDFITGTAEDAVVAQEQEPWLRAALAQARAAAAALEAQAPELLEQQRPRGRQAKAAASAAAASAVGRPEWKLRDGLLEVDTPYFHLEMAEEAGGAVVDAWETGSERRLLREYSNDLVSFRDSGGMWRMGHEFAGGRFEEDHAASRAPAHLQVIERGETLEIECTAGMDGSPITRRTWVDGLHPGLRFEAAGLAAPGRTLAVRFETGFDADVLTMDEPGGPVVRPVEKGYRPTFWPFQNYVQLAGAHDPHGILLYRRWPGAAAYRPGGPHGAGRLEMIAFRNAQQETGWGFLHYPGLPVRGREAAPIRVAYAVRFLGQAELDPARDRLQPGWDLFSAADAAAAAALHDSDLPGRWRALVESTLAVSPAEVKVLALKPAERGPGVIVRLYREQKTPVSVSLAPLGWQVTGAAACDARERVLHPLQVRPDGAVDVLMSGSLLTVWLQTREPAE